MNSTFIVQGNNQFALDLYRQVSASEQNVFFSPYSISTALAMTAAGARGETENAMLTALHLPRRGEELHRDYRELLRNINPPPDNDAYRLLVANRLWGQKGHEFRESYLKLLSDCYDAGLQEVDFRGNAEGARQAINKWIEQKTGDCIRDLLSSDAVNNLTQLILTNAIYFKAAWLHEFKKEANTRAVFFVTPSNRIVTTMMNQKKRFCYTETPEVQVLQMAYRDSGLSMIILLPRKHSGLIEFEKNFTCEQLDSLTKNLTAEIATVIMPKFKAESTFSLRKTLAQLGMGEIFTETADFSGIGPDLFISEVIHKAYVDVNEKGTEAAAATAVGIRATGLAKPPEREFVFKADHPFLYLITDMSTGAILFMGRLAEPKRIGAFHTTKDT